jgi:chromosome segregation ATPase
MNPSKLH